MMVSVKEPGIEFGEFDEDRLFQIEHSDIHKKAGEGIKSVDLLIHLICLLQLRLAGMRKMPV